MLNARRWHAAPFSGQRTVNRESGNHLIIISAAVKAVLLLVIIGVCDFVHVVDHKILSDKSAQPAYQASEDHPQKNCRTGFRDRHSVTLVGTVVNAVCLFVIPVKSVNSTGDDREDQDEDIIGAVFSVAVKYPA